MTVRLDALSLGFRSRYLPYAELMAQLKAWADAFPEVARLESLGQTPEGREIPLLTIGRRPDQLRPAAWVNGNLHASELSGSSVALAIAEDALRLHVDPSAPLRGLPEHLRPVLSELLFYVAPRVSPDGAEAVIETGRWVRSVPRDARPDARAPRWIAEDLDGDGLALLMRREDPTGEYVESSQTPGLLLPRRLEDPGPFYKVWPEGTIAHFDGHTVPDPSGHTDNYPDLNRNFPWSWAPEDQQYGAGEYPGSEPESRALIEFATAHPNLFAWLDLHTFGGVHIRPLGHSPDRKMAPTDLALFRQLGAWAEELTGYPMVSGFEEFTYSPETPLRGDLSDYAYQQRGCVAWVCELWDLFTQLGVERKARFVDVYSQLTRDELERMGAWDAEGNAGRILQPWRPFEHPQLGPVEIGGVDPRVGLWNPPYEQLPQVCEGMSALWMRTAALAPRLELTLERRPLEGELYALELKVRNLGYLPTHVLESAKIHAWNAPLSASLSLEAGALEAGAPTQALGHLRGWGRGLYSGDDALYFQRSAGNGAEAWARWVVRGEAQGEVQVGSARMGWGSASFGTD